MRPAPRKLTSLTGKRGRHDREDEEPGEARPMHKTLMGKGRSEFKKRSLCQREAQTEKIIGKGGKGGRNPTR